jgi:serine/threonine-protein kinase
MASETAGRSLRLPLPRTIAGRRRLIAVVVLLGSALGGYLTTCIAFPRPYLRRERPLPRVVGTPIGEAEAELVRAGFKVKLGGEEPDADLPAGRVRWQEPPPDVIAPTGTTVTLVGSSGPAAVAVPDVGDLDLEQASRIVAAAGLRVGDVDSVPNPRDPGVVVTSRPGFGTAQPAGTSVDLAVSRGPASVRVPSLVGLPLADARGQLEQAGLVLGRITRVPGRGAAGSVVEQRPAAGALSARGGRVDLTVAEAN